MPPHPNTLKKRFYEALGKFTATWASMESGLDILAIVAARNAAKAVEPSHQLAAKLKFIRKHLLPTMPPEHSTRLAKILDRIEVLSETRHELIHGAGLLEVANGELLVMKFGRLLQPKSQVRRGTLEVSTEQIVHKTTEVFEIWGDLLDFAQASLSGKFLR